MAFDGREPVLEEYMKQLDLKRVSDFLLEEQLVPKNIGENTLAHYAQMVRAVLGRVPVTEKKTEQYAVSALGLIANYKSLENTGKLSPELFEAALFRQAS